MKIRVSMMRDRPAMPPTTAPAIVAGGVEGFGDGEGVDKGVVPLMFAVAVAVAVPLAVVLAAWLLEYALGGALVMYLAVSGSYRVSLFEKRAERDGPLLGSVKPFGGEEVVAPPFGPPPIAL